MLPGDWLSTQEAADRLGITPRTLYRMIDTAQLPAYRIGRVIRLRIAEVDAYIESVRIAPGELTHLYPTPDHDKTPTRDPDDECDGDDPAGEGGEGT